MPHLNRRRMLRGGLALIGMELLAGCGLVPIPGQPVSDGKAGPRRIGYLTGLSSGSTFEGLRNALRELGYAEGTNLLIEFRSAEDNFERLPGLATELVDLRVELIVSPDTPSGQALSRATTTIPIVMLAGANNLIANFAHPERNITGLATYASALPAKWVQLLHEAVPTISHLATVSDPNIVSTEQSRSEAERAARLLQLQRVSHHDLRDLNQLPEVLSTVKRAGADGLVMLSGGVPGGGNSPRIGEQVLSVGLPAIAKRREFTLAGGLLAYGASLAWRNRRAASYVDKILKGAKPGDLPVEGPTEFDLVVNLKTARALGLAIPPSVMQQVTEVIE